MRRATFTPNAPGRAAWIKATGKEEVPLCEYFPSPTVDAEKNIVYVFWLDYSKLSEEELSAVIKDIAERHNFHPDEVQMDLSHGHGIPIRAENLIIEGKD